MRGTGADDPVLVVKVAVMALEQRGSVIQLNLSINHASGRNF